MQPYLRAHTSLTPHTPAAQNRSRPICQHISTPNESPQDLSADLSPILSPRVASTASSKRVCKMASLFLLKYPYPSTKPRRWAVASWTLPAHSYGIPTPQVVFAYAVAENSVGSEHISIGKVTWNADWGCLV